MPDFNPILNDKIWRILKSHWGETSEASAVKDLTKLIDQACTEARCDELKKASDKFDDLHQGTPGAGWVHYGELGENIDAHTQSLKTQLGGK